MNRFRVQLEPDDYVVAQSLHTRWTARQLAAYAIVLGVGVLLAALPSSNHWPFVIGCGLIGGAVSGGLVREVLRRFVLPRRTRKLFAQQKSLQRPVEFSWDEQALHWSSENGSGRSPWSDYLKRRQNERIVLLYLSDVMFQMIPKRSFEPPEQLQDFLRCVATVEER